MKTKTRIQISTTVPPKTKQQFEELRTIYGTATAVLILAIDRLYRADFPSDKALLRAGISIPCAKCGQRIDPASDWVLNIYGEAHCTRCQEGQTDPNI